MCCGGGLDEQQTSESCCLQSSREPPWCQRTRIERCKQEICQPACLDGPPLTINQPTKYTSRQYNQPTKSFIHGKKSNVIILLYFYWLPPMPSTQVKREIGVEHKVRCGMPGCQADYCTIVEGWSRREIDVEQILLQLSGECFEYT